MADTGLPVSITLFATFQKTFDGVELLPLNMSLFSYTEDAIPVRGVFEANARFGGREEVCSFYVVDQEHTFVGLNMPQDLHIALDVAKYSCKQVDATRSVAVQQTAKTAVTRAAPLQPVPFSTGP